MTTVMQWGNSDGAQGRCDARCHNATSPDCSCMCGGRYHGAARRPGGVEQVQREYGQEILAAAAARARSSDVWLDVGPTAQGELPL